MDFELHAGYFSRDQQSLLVEAIQKIVHVAPLFTPTMPKSGKPFSVRMTNCGRLGWVSDKAGYRYQAIHPITREPWPPMPELVMRAWQALSGYPHPPEACLVNVYDTSAKMGLHQDRDEEDFDAPVISISLGDTCIFRIGGLARSDPTKSIRLTSGDIVVLGGSARMVFHGVDRIISGTSTLMKEGGRINLTLRRVTKPST